MIPGYEVIHRLSDTMLGAELGEDARILVVGAGTGAEILESGSRHTNWRFTVVEPSTEMSAIGKKALEDAGVAARVERYEGSLEALGDSPPFDAALLILVLHFLSDGGEKGTFLEKIAQRLKPGAPFFLVSYFGDPQNTRTKKLYELARAWAVNAGVTPEEAAEKLNPARTDMHLVPEERIKNLLREAGFIDVQRVYQGLLIGGWLCRTQRAREAPPDA
jgi:tRNA (cmo5U34)-methyltransferase